MRLLLVVFLLFPLPGWADPSRQHCSEGRWGKQVCIRATHYTFDTCQALRDQAQNHGIDPGFFARLIWQESRFKSRAVSPADARGIAQFIDSTARLRGLKDQFNPSESLEKSAEYLSFLIREFGNEGLAAVAYNAGEQRAASFKQGRRLPRETRRYVHIITGLSAETWRDNPPEFHDFRLSRTDDFLKSCFLLAKNRGFSGLTAPEDEVAPWGVQIGSGTNETEAETEYTRLTESCRNHVEDETPDLITIASRNAEQPGQVFARIGRPSMSEAIRLCRKMQAEGCDCSVEKN